MEVFLFSRALMQTMEWDGALFCLAQLIPALFSVAGAVGFVVTALHGIVMLKNRRVISNQLRLNSKIAKLVASAAVGGCLSTTMLLIFENNSQTLASRGGPVVLWWCLWVLWTPAIYFSIICVEALTARRNRHDGAGERED